MYKKGIIVLSAMALITACSSSAPRIAVDPSTITSQEQYDKDFESCLNLAKTVDLGDEKATKAVAGAAMGTAAVAGVATAVAGAIFAPAIPFMIAGGAAGGGLWGSSVSAEEKAARESILTQCLGDKGYRVYASKNM
jgi:hypothetical protein